MTDSQTNRPSVFIEKIFPVTLLNQQVYYEHGGNPFKGLHRWYSRKPLSFSRASVLGSLLPDSVTPEEFEYLLGLERRLGGVPDTKTKLYKTPPSPERIKQVHDLCEKTWGTRTPTVLDAFAGGGSIPFEAVRYGLNVLASDLNPVAVVTMKAAMEYPLKFGPDLQAEINKWVKWVGDEVEERQSKFFPSLSGETTINYLWAHTMKCPSCESVIPLSPNWWLYRRLGESNYKYWCAVKPIANLSNKRVDFQLMAGGKGKGKTIKTDDGDYDPDTASTINRGAAKCTNCGSIIEEDVIKEFARSSGLGYQLYSVVFRRHDKSLGFRTPCRADFDAYKAATERLLSKRQYLEMHGFLPTQSVPKNTHRGPDLFLYGITCWADMFNDRQLLTLGTFVEVIDQVKKSIAEENPEKVEVISTYLALILDRCVDMNSRLSRWRGNPPVPAGVSSSHSLNLMWNYPETTPKKLWEWCSKTVSSDYTELTSGYLGRVSTNSESILNNYSVPSLGLVKIDVSSADSLIHISDKSVDVVVTDPPYYDSIRYGEISDFFYVWLRANLLDVLPNIFLNELTNKENEAIANPGRFRNMGESAEDLADRDYEAKMALAFMEYYRVLNNDGVMIVQFNHKDSGAWDVLAKSLIDAGFEITASWAVSTENPRNLHQAQKNSVSSTVLLVCRKRDLATGQAWWDDLRPELANLVEQRAPEFEANDIKGIDLYLSAFGPALNVFSRSWPVLDSAGNEVRPEEAFSEARKAIANYRFRKLLQTDTAGFDPLTQWYILAWDAFRAREFPFDEARQLALAVGGFNVTDLAKVHKLIDSASGTCKLLSPQQRLKKRAFTLNPDEFSSAALVDCLHAIIALYLEEQSIEPVRRFMKATGLLSNDLFMRAWEVALKVFPPLRDERKRIPEEKALADLWLAMDEIQSKVIYVQPELPMEEEQKKLF
ncbi:MAG: DNA methylase [Phormidesmis priestleyi]|uniref:DNA methylase n=1 Tax=Phormidesmis priestleyi TaxID=268141 RepID=A0A2W4XTJ8_9CYAN|nr:MAG: DNA methylase [Phormidesmis priestleyi]